MATTPNLGLHQWEPGDGFLRSDFNEDFQKIDSGVAGRCRMACGTYRGTSTGEDGALVQTVSLPFTPKLVWVCSRGASEVGCYSGLALEGDPQESSPWSTALKIVPGGFEAGSWRSNGTQYYPALNSGGFTYHYLALG